MLSSSVAQAGWNPRSDRKAYIVWMALVWAGTLAGFGLDFPRYLAEQPAPPLILHLHGAAYTLWLVLVSVQIFLIETGDVRRHKQLGWATAVVSAVLVPLGLAAAMVDMARQVNHPDYAPQFLGLEFVDMVVFAALITAGLMLRKDLAAHKRLMILAAVSIADASFSRVWSMVFKITVPGPFGWWMQYFWGTTLMLLSMAAWDLWRRRRIHPTVLAGAAFLWTGQIVLTVLEYSVAWKAAMVGLVRARAPRAGRSVLAAEP
jgi:hypothetical protein